MAATAIRYRDSVGDRGRVEAFHLEVEVPEGTAFVEVSGFAEKLLTRRGRAALIRVASETEVLVSWSNDPEDVGRALAGVIPGGSTLLNDASIHASMEIHSLRGRKALELLTDDADTNLRTAAELLDLGFGVSL